MGANMALAALTMSAQNLDLNTTDFFLARQPILNIEQELVGYELLFRHSEVNSALVDNNMRATAAVVEHAAELGLHNVIGTSVAFLNVDAGILMSDAIFILPKQHVVLEILETVELSKELMARIEVLAANGYVFAIDDVVEESYRIELLMPLVDIVKVDVLQMPAEKVGALTDYVKLRGKKLLAEKVETIEQFKLCREYGFDYYQGYYFARPDVLKGKKISQSSLHVMQILALILKGANNFEIVRLIKQDVALSLTLLRLVNTPLYGCRRNVASLGHALLILGDRQLRRWMQILLYANQGCKRGENSSPLMIMAATRGKLCELLAQAANPRRLSKSDTAFTVGVLSLTDALFNIDVADIVEQIGVSLEIREALLSRTGFFGNLLRLVEYSENPDSFDLQLLNQLLGKLQLSREAYYRAQKEAFDWGGSISVNMSNESIP